MADKALAKAAEATRENYVVIAQKPGTRIHLRSPIIRAQLNTDGRVVTHEGSGKPVLERVRGSEWIEFKRCVASTKWVETPEGNVEEPLTLQDIEAVRRKPGFGSEYQDGETLVKLAKEYPQNFTGWLAALVRQAQIARLSNADDIALEIRGLLQEFGYQLPRSPVALRR